MFIWLGQSFSFVFQFPSAYVCIGGNLGNMVKYTTLGFGEGVRARARD